jgi:EmrB/QacA subfamily drug resistance transporter
MLFFKQPCDEGIVLTSGGPRPCERAAHPWILATTILGSSLAFIDGTVVNVALPALQRGLGASITDVQWVVEAYALLFAALLLVGGSMGDRFGRRRVYAIGIVVFTVASALCGAASSVRYLVIARALQGIGAALLVPGSLALIAASFPEEERGRAIGTWSGFSAITTASGPVLGGWLIEHLSWRWGFLLNLPLAAVVLLLLFWRVPESRDQGAAAAALDWRGAGLVTLGLGGLVYGLIESSRLGWGNAMVVTGLAGGTAALVVFVLVERKSRAPMVPMSLFRSRTFTGANLLTLGVYGALGATFFFFPMALIHVHRYTATAAGAATLPAILILFLLSRWSGGLLARLGARTPLIAGPIVAAAGFALLAVPGTGGSYWSTYFPGVVVLGSGMALTVAPLTTTVMNAVDVGHAGLASGINNAVSRTAGLLAIALMSIVVVQVFEHQLERRSAALGLRPEIAEEVRSQKAMLGSLEPPDGATEAERTTISTSVAESFVSGFRWMALACAALALASSGAAAALVDGGAGRSSGSARSKAARDPDRAVDRGDGRGHGQENQHRLGERS